MKYVGLVNNFKLLYKISYNCFLNYFFVISYNHWRRLDKILSGQTKILEGQKVVQSDKCMGVSQLLGARARYAPLSLRLWL